MPNQRSRDQILLTFAAKVQFVEELDSGLKSIGAPSRSHFIREAILEKLGREGVKIPRSLAAPPDRTGKGGPKPS